MDNNTAKAIGFAIVGLIGIFVVMSLLPYIVMFLALCGAWHLYEQYNKRGKH